ncbi:Methyltransferase type 11 [Pleurostoma richardsiae]|uniref:Methyltransferase type 11 n=1 Tax=Pleurostoma richardsiae TaxID=41990 RepID=A0AA38VCI9_9PEZI|nr:Methyltransferase type 11 [Pleurostoma richardsiae]
MSGGNERFNDEAAAWDSNPDVHRASDGALQAILGARPDLTETIASDTAAQNGVDVLEIGCGTGLLSFRLAPYVRSILAIDAAQGMISALEQKLARDTGVKNIRPLCVMLEDPEDPALPPGPDVSGPRKKFDLVTSHLVLHHIADLESLLRTMYGCLKPGGQVALTDYQDFGPKARSFHPESKMFGVERHGIKADWFAGLMRDAGFADVSVAPAWTMEKEVERFPGEWGETKPTGANVTLATMGFPFLLCRGTKKG